METRPDKDELIDLLERTLLHTRFDAGRYGAFSAEQMRSMHEQGTLLLDPRAPLVQTVVPDDALRELSNELGRVMVRFVNPETGSIGNGLVDLMGGFLDCSLTDFAKEVVTAGATLGPKDAIGMLFGWIDGGPLQYQTKALLTGVKVDHPLVLEGGLRIEQLPKSSSELMPYQHAPPSMLGSADSYVELLGSTLLSVDCEASPAFYRPSSSGIPWENVQRSRKVSHIPEFSIDTFCEALSLACNHAIRCRGSWGFYGDLRHFNRVAGWGRASPYVPHQWLQARLSQKQLCQARELLALMNAEVKSRRGLSTAIHRWINSKSEETIFVDRFIEIRIALESLYLKARAGEMRFRLAITGAWHLGRNLEERRDYYELLRTAYDRSSKAVHAGDIEDTESNRRLLARAQDVCREGILKCLSEPEKPNWDDLILGAEIEALS